MKNYLTAVAIASCALLTACASPQPEPTGIALTNKEIKDYIVYKELEESTNKLTGDYCVDAAKYGRTMSFLVNSGIPMNSLDDYIVNPKVVNFPVRTIQFYVANNKGNPGQVYDEILSTCLKSGWIKLAQELKDSGPPPIAGLKLSRSLSAPPVNTINPVNKKR